jgi:predicted small metal-binding protein
MKEELKRVECEPDCGFAIQSHNEKELMNITKEHAKKMHNMIVTPSAIRDMMKPVSG